MRDWLGMGDSRSWDDTALCICSTQCAQYSVYAVLGVHSWSWDREIEPDDLTFCAEVKIELRTRKRDKERRWAIIMRYWDLGKLDVQDNLAFLTWQVQLQLQLVITPIHGLLHATRYVVPLISHLRLYPPYHSHLPPSSLSCPQLYHHVSAQS